MADNSILFKNSDYIAVDKAAGISVHNHEDHENLLEWLEKEHSFSKLYPVHRLDKETSGVQILALNANSARSLAEEFQKRTVKKIYFGLLRGQLKIREGLWSQPLTDKSEGRKNPQGLVNDRVLCETKFHVVKSTAYFTLCEFDLFTGRQHQIRKHAALAKHPLVGDGRYGDPKYNEKIVDLYKIDRMFLHCSKIEILGQKI